MTRRGGDRETRPLRVLLVGQTPPPVHGQAVMLEMLAAAEYPGVRIHHVRMDLSHETGEIGRFAVVKIGRLLALIARTWVARVRWRTPVLYYPPAGPNRIPMWRDIAFLLSTRWMFRRTVFHFHAAGVSELYPRLGRPARALFRLAYFDADLAIRVGRLSPPDPARLRARQERVIPNACDDWTARLPGRGQILTGAVPTILFAGILREAKGVLVLLEAAAMLRSSGRDFRVRFMGTFESHEFEGRMHRRVADLGLADATEFLGLLSGIDKHSAYREADIFCLPTHFEAESAPLVLIEAMQWGLAIVATRWRGIPGMLEDEESAVLVPVRAPAALAEAIGRLIADPDTARRLGRQARQTFERNHSTRSFHEAMQAVFTQVARSEARQATPGGS